MKFFQIKCGSRRTIFLIGKYVIKIPKFKSWVSFIKGICENLEERYWWSSDGSRKRNPKQLWNHLYLAEIFWADRFGFIVVMERVSTFFIKEGEDIQDCYRSMFNKDMEKLIKEMKGYHFGSDIKPSNVGYSHGRLVLLDYGYTPATLDCYLGT